MYYVNIIEVPDLNDSVSTILMLNKQYQLRFTWNETGGYWTFGLMDSMGTPIALGVKILPGFPLNLYFGTEDGPRGMFAVLTEEAHVGRKDFIDGKAKFVFIPTL